MLSMRISGLADRIEEARAAVGRSPRTGLRSSIWPVHCDATGTYGSSLKNVRNMWIKHTPNGIGGSSRWCARAMRAFRFTCPMHASQLHT